MVLLVCNPIISQLLRYIFPTFLELGKTKIEVGVGAKKIRKGKRKALFVTDPTWYTGLTVHELRLFLRSNKGTF